MTAKVRPNDAKLKELILYIAERSADDAFFGATKLNKILFYSDFLAYAHFGEPITGHTYFRLPHGPAPRRLKPIQEDMIRDHEIALSSVQKYAFRQKRIVPLRPADLESFTADELDLVQEVIDALRSYTAEMASDLSHTFMGWQLVEDYEDIPYETIFLTSESPDADHLEQYRQLAVERGWVKDAVPA